MKINELFEARRVVPTKSTQIKKLKIFLDKFISVAEAEAKLKGIIESDDLNDLFDFVAEKNPKTDARPIVTQWLQENVPDILSQDDYLDTFYDGTRSPIFGNVDDMKEE